jgi:hypothetical protein
MIFNPADGTYVYVDDAEDPGAQAPGIDLTSAMSRYTGSTPSSTPPAGTTDPNVAPTPQGLDQFGDYDPTYESTRANALASQNAAETNYSTGMQNLQTAFAPQFSALDQQHSDDLDYLQNMMANQGILRSSNNLTAQGRLNDQYQGQEGSLRTQQQMNEQSLSQQRLADMLAAQQSLTSAEGSHAQFLSGRADARAHQQAATEAAQQALVQQNPGFSTTPTGQIVQSPAIQYATSSNPVGLIPPGSNLGQSPGVQPQSGGGQPPYLPVQQDNGASFAAYLAQQQQQMQTPPPPGSGGDPSSMNDQELMNMAGGDPNLLAAMMRRLGLMQ